MVSNFYTSDAWRGLVQGLRLERLNERGELLCEYCHKPIVHKYDCIGHHSIPLTEQNVDDANISLNPDLIQLVHHRCHNKIHDRLGLSYTRQVYLVYGSPLSGKTTWVRDSMTPGDLVVDMDSIWQCVSGMDRYSKPNRLKQNVFAVRDCLLDMVRVRRGNWLNAYIIGGYPLSSERLRLVRTLGAREVFVDTSQAECLQRLQDCTDGRDFAEWENYIVEWWEKYTPPTST